MKNPIHSTISLIRGVCGDRRGVSALIVATMAIVLLAFAGFAIDVGHALEVKNALQAATDAAALAGAKAINTCQGSLSCVTSAAETYSSVNSYPGKNKIPNITVQGTTAGFSATVSCLTSTGVWCGPSNSYGNAIVVKQSAAVPTMFARVLGFPTFTVSATSTASASGGGKPLNVIIILDTTASMSQADTNGGCGSGTTKVQCAIQGAQIILNNLNPATDYVALMTFPGLTSSSAPTGLTQSTPVADDICPTSKALTACNISPYYNPNANPSATPPTWQSGGSNPNYVITTLANGNTYRTSSTSKSLNASSSIVGALGAGSGATTCATGGMQALGGVGTYFTDVITQAQQLLVAFQTTRLPTASQNVIIFLGDGDANAGNSSGTGTTKTVTCNGNQVTFNNMPANASANECHSTIAAAKGAAAAGTWVYAIAYDSSGSGCSTDTPNISPCYTMQHIANSPGVYPDETRFYSDNQSACASVDNTYTSLSQIFAGITNSLLPVKMIPNGTQ